MMISCVINEHTKCTCRATIPHVGRLTVLSLVFHFLLKIYVVHLWRNPPLPTPSGNGLRVLQKYPTPSISVIITIVK